MTFIVLGSKLYEKIKMDGILDSFERNIRTNTNFPRYNNGTKLDIYGLNNHLYHNIINLKNKKTLNHYKDWYTQDFLKELIDWSNKNIHKCSSIINNNNYNSILKNANSYNSKINIPVFKMPLRMGYIGIYYLLFNNHNQKPIYVFGFSLKGYETKYAYINKLEVQGHDDKSEQKILIGLHQKKIVDATLCLLLDVEEPTLLGNVFEPRNEIIELILKFYKKCYIVDLSEGYKDWELFENKSLKVEELKDKLEITLK